ncbi:MAG: pantetheine-phosphate adenylyltransferase [Candidatus Omnitrophica bacterium]|nr:pantetheine-phosphate adenylyltransferase [Candidatus Omnitrophota bacterium]MDE2010347.1 pantetheine-phosphate adenylyltransferase [Candidatus Omnitrophota bacterium]MDE2215434.1 pantetheine-phosphate adenylyltransferase [Candidatus Omnitrophota bacterium]MDE2232250.1 pantetheine-phosphate adenylyltransferase [Candidatus Omnitrophota bacterium]
MVKEQGAIYPGSFDPVTNGHLDVIQRAARIFERVIVAVADNTGKKALFPIRERLELLREVTKDIKNVSVETFDSLVVEYARRKKINVLIRGLRMTSDFDYEFQIALTNRRLAEDIETVFLMPSEHVSFVSSSLLKEIASLGADVSSFVPGAVERKLKEKLNRSS